MNIPKIQFRPNEHKYIGIEIIELSDIYQRYNNTDINFSAKPHRINFHTLLYVTQGHGTHFVDFNNYPIQTGSVVFISSNQIHAFDLINQPQGKLIIFTDDFLNTLFSTMKIPFLTPNHLLASNTPIFTLTDKIKDTCDVLLTEIDKEHQLTDPNLNFLHLMFSALLTKITGSRSKPYQEILSDDRARVFKRFIFMLEQNYTAVRDAKKYADMLNITYKSLNQICKLATNQTTKQLIDAHTVLEAKRRLSIEDIRVQQLADELGFDEVTNFVKYFKKHTLLTPPNSKNRWLVRHLPF